MGGRGTTAVGVRGAVVLVVALAGLAGGGAWSVGTSALASGSTPSPIQGSNRPNSLPGMVNGRLPASALVSVAPGCVAERAAAASLSLLLAEARASGIALGTEECYRPLSDQVAVQQQWTAAGNSACAAPVLSAPTGAVGTSIHGWGRAADFAGADGNSLGFGSPGYAFLKANAGRLGWNHPAWAEPGGSPCPEPWHWEWVGDGGTDGAASVRADVVTLLPSAAGLGYASVNGLGQLTVRGDAVDRGGVPSVSLGWVITGGAMTPDGGGYWLAGGDGTVYALGDATPHGSLAGIRLAAPIVAMTATPTGGGYWLAAADGGIFAFGDATFVGSTGGLHLHRPIVGMTPTASGHGYWMVASDGGIFAFGDAVFTGSMGATALNQPVVAMTASASGHGYWLVAADGGVFRFGDAPFVGSLGATPPALPVVAMARTLSGRGYWLVGVDGKVAAFGDAGSFGDA